MFAFPDDEYRTRIVPHDPFGSTAHEDVLKAGIAVSRNNDQIGLTIAGDIGDYFKGSAYADNHCLSRAQVQSCFLPMHPTLSHGPDRKTLAHRNVSQIRWVGRGFYCVQQSDLCSKMLCERHRVIKRFLRDSGEIDWHKDTLEFEHRRDGSSNIAFPNQFFLPVCNSRDFRPAMSLGRLVFVCVFMVFFDWMLRGMMQKDLGFCLAYFSRRIHAFRLLPFLFRKLALVN